MKKMIGTLLMIFPIQLFASHVAIANGLEFGGIAWWASVICAGVMFNTGMILSA